jgi:hypothetical protein
MQTGINHKFLVAVCPPCSIVRFYRLVRKEGIVVIRQGQRVLKVCNTSNIYGTVTYLFQKNGALKGYDKYRVMFEIINTTYDPKLVTRCLRHLLEPIECKRKPSLRMVRAADYEHIIDSYTLQSRYDFGDSKTDHNNDNTP